MYFVNSVRGKRFDIPVIHVTATAACAIKGVKLLNISRKRNFSSDDLLKDSQRSRHHFLLLFSKLIVIKGVK